MERIIYTSGRERRHKHYSEFFSVDETVIVGGYYVGWNVGGYYGGSCCVEYNVMIR